MLKKGREAYIESALSGFMDLVMGYKGIVKARVFSAVALTEVQTSELKTVLDMRLGKRVEIEAAVDPSLIGGLLVKAGGVVLDSTVKRHLRILRKRMA